MKHILTLIVERIAGQKDSWDRLYVYIYVYVYLQTCMHIHMLIDLHAYIHIYTYRCNTSLHTWSSGVSCKRNSGTDYMYTYMYMYIYACIYIYIHMLINLYLYIHICRYRWKTSLLKWSSGVSRRRTSGTEPRTCSYEPHKPLPRKLKIYS